MIIRQIRETDLSALSILMDFYTLKPEQAIHNGERQRMQEQGFLLGEYSIEKMRNDISKIFFVAEEEGRIIGYTRVDDGMDLEYQNFDYRGLVDWKSEEYKKKFYEKPQYIIGGLLVAKECGRRGIAGQFLQKVCEKLEQKKRKEYLLLYQLLL